MATKHSRWRRQRLSFFQLFRHRVGLLLASFNSFTILKEGMAQSKTTPFKAYDLRRKRMHTIEGSGNKPAPRKTSIHRIVRSDWAVPKVAKGTRSSPRKSTKKPTKAASLTAASLLRCESEEVCCLHCRRFGDDPECGTKCYAAFKKLHNAEKLIEIKGPGKHGYGAFTKPGAVLKKGDWLGEYVGQLTPLGVATTSLYRFEIPDVCAIDAEPCGNWTRFVNSSCTPNVTAWTETIGKRQVVYFQASKDIGPETELTFNYGKGYFQAAGFECQCPAMKRPHMPGEAKKAARALK